MAQVAFRLIEVLQSQVRSQLKWAKAKTKRFGFGADVGTHDTLSEAQIANGQLNSCHGLLSCRCRKALAREDLLGRLVHRDSVSTQLVLKFQLCQPADRNDSGDDGT